MQKLVKTRLINKIKIIFIVFNIFKIENRAEIIFSQSTFKNILDFRCAFFYKVIEKSSLKKIKHSRCFSKKSKIVKIYSKTCF